MTRIHREGLPGPSTPTDAPEVSKKTGTLGRSNKKVTPTQDVPKVEGVAKNISSTLPAPGRAKTKRKSISPHETPPPASKKIARAFRQEVGGTWSEAVEPKKPSQRSYRRSSKHDKLEIITKGLSQKADASKPKGGVKVLPSSVVPLTPSSSRKAARVTHVAETARKAPPPPPPRPNVSVASLLGREKDVKELGELLGKGETHFKASLAVFEKTPKRFHYAIIDALPKQALHSLQQALQKASIDEDDSSKIEYSNLRLQAACLVRLEKERDVISHFREQMKEKDLVECYETAIQENNSLLLTFLQKHAIADVNGLTALHVLGEQSSSAHVKDLGKKLIEVSGKEQLHIKRTYDLKTAFVRACEKGNLDLVQALYKKDPTLLQEKSKNDNLPLHSLLSSRDPPENLSEVVQFIVKNSTHEQLFAKNKEGKTAFDIALEHHHMGAVESLLPSFIAELSLERTPVLSERLWAIVTKYELQSEHVKALLEGLHNPALSSRFYTLVEKLGKKGVSPSELLKLTLFLERNQSIQGISKITKDLVQSKLSAPAVAVVVEHLSEVQKKRNGDKMGMKVVEKALHRFQETMQLKEMTKTLPSYAALITAFVIEYEIPRIQSVSQALISGKSNTIAEGWRILKEKEHIYVVTGHLLGKGTFKKASAVAQLTLFNQRQAQLVPKPIVYLEPLDQATHEEREEIAKEAETFKKLEGMPGIVRCFHVRRGADLQDLGMMVEHCETDIEKLVATRESLNTKTPRERLQIFRGVVEGVVSMHSKGLVHADLKPGNCPLKDGKGKISDFGTSFEATKEMAPAVKNGFHSTPSNTSYELYKWGEECREAKAKNKAEPKPNFDPFSVDLSALGDILKVLYDGITFPFENDLFEAAGIAGLIPEFRAQPGAKAMSAAGLQAALQKEIVKPLKELLAKKSKTRDDTIKLHMYSLIALSKGIHPSYPNQKPTAQLILQECDKVLAAL